MAEEQQSGRPSGLANEQNPQAVSAVPVAIPDAVDEAELLDALNWHAQFQEPYIVLVNCRLEEWWAKGGNRHIKISMPHPHLEVTGWVSFSGAEFDWDECKFSEALSIKTEGLFDLACEDKGGELWSQVANIRAVPKECAQEDRP